MTSERARAYRHVLNLVDALAAAKLHPDEQAVVRDAADALLFSAGDVLDAEAHRARARLAETLDGLVDGERIMPATAEDILDAVEACGPPRVAA